MARLVVAQKPLIANDDQQEEVKRIGPRKSGLGFYSDRGRVYRFSRTFFRDKHRTPHELEAVQLARELAKLAAQYPRFNSPLNRLRHFALVQVRRQLWKDQVVFRRLSATPITPKELSEETKLDSISIQTTLEHLKSLGKAQRCNRMGHQLVEPVIGQTSYWNRPDRT